MRGLDLSIFDVDYDLTWNALFLNAQGEMLGRFNQRGDPRPSLKGLRFALESAVKRHNEKSVREKKSANEPGRGEHFPAGQRMSATACIHCHHIYEFRREYKQDKGIWRRDDFWVYPEPANLGLTLDPDQGNRIKAVAAGSLAGKAGLKAGDVLQTIEQSPIASQADVAYALHRASSAGIISLAWDRARVRQSAKVVLHQGWKETDLSWRWSLKSLKPSPQVQGDDLSEAEKKALGLRPEQLAFRQNAFVTRPAQRAGMRAGDVIVGIDGKDFTLTARQFDTHVRMNYEVGAGISYRVRRGTEIMWIKLKLID
jgi:predicted metalloprotease with PDZ domain